MKPEDQRTGFAQRGNRVRSGAIGIALGIVLGGLAVLALWPHVDPSRTWLQEAVVSWSAWRATSLAPSTSKETVPVARVAQQTSTAPFGPSVGLRVKQWGQTLDRAIRDRLTIPLPEDVRHLFPNATDSLVLDPETVWLARCIYSESNRPREQELVAWVVRNRVVAGYRGKLTIRDVVLDPYQFSAFNPGHPRRAYYLSLLPEHTHASWQRALRIAAYVRRAPWSKRPFSVRVRHFYSEISMKGPSPPRWARGASPIRPDRPYPVDPVRFRFFALNEPLELNWPGIGREDLSTLQIADAIGLNKSILRNDLRVKANATSISK